MGKLGIVIDIDTSAVATTTIQNMRFLVIFAFLHNEPLDEHAGTEIGVCRCGCTQCLLYSSKSFSSLSAWLQQKSSKCSSLLSVCLLLSGELKFVVAVRFSLVVGFIIIAAAAAAAAAVPPILLLVRLDLAACTDIK